MPWWLAIPWNAVVGFVVWICAFPRDIRIDGNRVIVTRRFLALIPVWRRSYAVVDFEAIKDVDASLSPSGEATIEVGTVYLVHKSGKHVPVQSYSDGADNQPPQDQLERDLKKLLGLSIVRG